MTAIVNRPRIAAGFHRSIRRAAAVMLTLLVLAATPAAAEPLDDARAAGHVGELANGLLGLVNPAAPADVKALVGSINAERKARYDALAKQHGSSPDAVGAVVFQKLVERLPPGSYFQPPGGGWTRK